MAKLNSEQSSAVAAIKGPVLVLAGAGSGKTRVITHRIQSMMLDYNVKATSILALSFTNKSAKEMKARLTKMVGRKYMRGITMGTFHSLGVKLLKNEIHLLGYRPKFSIFSATDSLTLAEELLKREGIDEEEIDPKFLLWTFRDAKNISFHEKAQVDHLYDEYGAVVSSLFEKYQKHLKAYNALDFEDLIILPARILHEHEEIKIKYRKKFQYILIDEFQDTNPTQYKFVKLLLNRNENIMVVGDDDQSIYGWRGADLSLILNFEKDFPKSKVVRLEHNYRSTGIILEAANNVIHNNKTRKEKKLKANRGRGDSIKMIHALDEEHEAKLVTTKIAEHINNDYKPGDIAILMRTNFQSRPFEEQLRKRGISYNLIGAYKFFDRKEVKDILSYLRVIANSRDEISLMRIINFPKRGIGESSIAKINNYCREEKIIFWEALEKIRETEKLIKGLNSKVVATLYEFMDFIEQYRKSFFGTRTSNRHLSRLLITLIEDINYEKELVRLGEKEEVIKAKMYNLNELVSSVQGFEDNWEESKAPSIQDYLSKVSLLSDDNDKQDEQKSKVQIMTTHLSKGLEFPAVFLVGMEDNIFPNPRAIEERDDGLEEERRLFYVAITRAMTSLTISACQYRKKFGEILNCEPSRFIDEIGSDIIKWENWDEEKKQQKDDEVFDDQLAQFKDLFN